MKRRATGTAGIEHLRELLLTAGAIAGLLCLLAAVASAFLGVKPLVFRSGSMSPAIETGALALARTVPASELRPGDIVSVTTPETRITHRVVEVEPVGDRVALVLKGDANAVADAAPYLVETADLVFFHVDGLGYAVSWLSSAPAVFLGGLIVGGLLVAAFGAPGRRPPGHRPSHRTTRTRARREAGANPGKRIAAMSALAAVGLSAGVVVVAGPPVQTEAAFTDAGTASGSVTAITVAPVTNLRCISGSGGLLGLLGSDEVDIAWTHVAAGYRYRLDVYPTGDTGTPLKTYWVVPNVAVGSSVGLRFSPDDLSTSRGNDFTVVVRSYPGTATSWLSAAQTTWMTEQRGGLLSSDSMECGN